MSNDDIILTNATSAMPDDPLTIEELAKHAADLRAGMRPRTAIEAWVTGKFPRYVADKIIPTEQEQEDGTRVPVLGYVVGGVLYIHPDREPMVRAAIVRLGVES